MSAFVTVYAHLGHWYVSVPLYLGPVVVIAGLVKVAQVRERRRAKQRDGD